MQFLLALFHFLCLRVVVAISVQDIPQCAQNCLSNSTAAQTSCTVIDIACLCSSSTYVSTLSCCLYTQCNSDEQTLAIQFNKQECAAVNETAPDFVGCSPAGLSSALASMSLTPLPPAPTSSPIPSSSSSVNPKISTITGDVVPEFAAPTSGKQSMATFDGRPLMTGSCTVPYFAIITDAGGIVTEYPNIGCSSDRSDCCAYPDGSNEAITRCPQDHFTTANACCPFGFQIYYTAIGGETPCYSNPDTKLVPATTATGGSGITLITDHVFAQKYQLVTPSPPQSDFPLGAKIGIPVASVIGLAFLGGLIWFFRRRSKAKKAGVASRSTTFPPEEPALHQMDMSRRPTRHELDNPEVVMTHPAVAGAAAAGSPALGDLGGKHWQMFPGSSPPAYDQKSLLFSSPSPAPPPPPTPAAKSIIIPQELPGSTFIHEHHPAFTPVVASGGTPAPTPTSSSPAPAPAGPHSPGDSAGPGTETHTPTPGSPPRTPPVQSPVSVSASFGGRTSTPNNERERERRSSPGLSSGAPTPSQTPRSETHSPVFVSPLGSPRLPKK